MGNSSSDDDDYEPTGPDAPMEEKREEEAQEQGNQDNAEAEEMEVNDEDDWLCAPCDGEAKAKMLPNPFLPSSKERDEHFAK